MLNIKTLKSDIACLKRVREELIEVDAGEKALAVVDGMIDGNERTLDALEEAWIETHNHNPYEYNRQLLTERATNA